MSPPMTASKLPAEVVNELLHAAADPARRFGRSRGHRIPVNRGAESLFGYSSRTELVGQAHRGPDSQGVSRSARLDSAGKVRRGAQGATPAVRGLNVVRQTQGRQPLPGRGRVDADTDGEAVPWSRARSARSTPYDESEAYFRTLLESAPDAMIIVDGRGRICCRQSGRPRTMFGYGRDELLGQADGDAPARARA